MFFLDFNIQKLFIVLKKIDLFHDEAQFVYLTNSFNNN